ncbi:VanZ family protein, partial [Saccharopolyspora sp. 6T]
MYQLFMAFDGFVPALTVLFPLAVLVAAVSGTVRSNRLRSVSPLHDPLIDALLVFAVLFTGYLVFYPQPEIADRVEMELGNDLYTALRAAPGDIRPWVQLGGNLMLLIPMATLVPLRVRWFDGFGKIVIGGLLTALTIETIQFFCIPGRVA